MEKRAARTLVVCEARVELRRDAALDLLGQHRADVGHRLVELAGCAVGARELEAAVVVAAVLDSGLLALLGCCVVVYCLCGVVWGCEVFVRCCVVCAARRQRTQTPSAAQNTTAQQRHHAPLAPPQLAPGLAPQVVTINGFRPSWPDASTPLSTVGDTVAALGATGASSSSVSGTTLETLCCFGGGGGGGGDWVGVGCFSATCVGVGAVWFGAAQPAQRRACARPQFPLSTESRPWPRSESQDSGPACWIWRPLAETPQSQASKRRGGCAARQLWSAAARACWRCVSVPRARHFHRCAAACTATNPRRPSSCRLTRSFKLQCIAVRSTRTTLLLAHRESACSSLAAMRCDGGV